jgi:hypothetical protein
MINTHTLPSYTLHVASRAQEAISRNRHTLPIYTMQAANRWPTEQPPKG